MSAMLFDQNREIEAEGFHLGMQGISVDTAQMQLQALVAQQKEGECLKAGPTIRQEEAKISTLERLMNEAEQCLHPLKTLTGGLKPPMVLPVMAVVTSLLIVIGEGAFLAPVMAGLGIADLLEQHLLAFVLVLVASGLMKIAIHQLHHVALAGGDGNGNSGANERVALSAEGVLKLAITSVLVIFTLALISVLGWWRAEELMFMAAENQTLAGFLNGAPTLTRLCVTLLTLGLPVVAAIALDWGLRGVSLAWQWRRAQRDHRRHSRQLEQSRKRLEAMTESLNHKLVLIDERQREWTQALLKGHELGRTVGAEQPPRWRVWLKIGAFAVLLLAGCLLLDGALTDYVVSGWIRCGVYACVLLGGGGFYAAHLLRVWERPAPRELYRERKIIWRDQASNGASARDFSRQTSRVAEAEV